MNHLSNPDGSRSLALGTYQILGDDVGKAVNAALNAGYRHFDCAIIYENEALIGKALAESSVRRKNIFITGKVWIDTFHDKELVRKSVLQSIKNLTGMFKSLEDHYLDAVLLHWPGDMYLTAYKVLEDMVDEELIRHIGLSNFTIESIEEIRAIKPRYAPYINQLEVNPMNYDEVLIDYCKDKNIKIMAYKPLGRGTCLTNETVTKISSKNNITPAQLLLAWGEAKGFIMTVKSVNENRLVENSISVSVPSEDLLLLDDLTSQEGLKALRSKTEDLSRLHAIKSIPMMN